MRYSYQAVESQHARRGDMILGAAVIVLTVLFALNMGGSNFGASFAAAYGSKTIGIKGAQILFIIFVILGAVLVGRPVAKTLSTNIIPSQLLKVETILIIFSAVTVSLFVANLLKVPQSTSVVTVFSIVGVGIYYKSVYVKSLLYLLLFWILFPLAGYVLTYLLGKIVYPPRKSNFWIYEKLVNQQKRFKRFVLFSSCYNAFAVGTNNVANAVGPLLGAGLIAPIAGLALVAPVFGLGSYVFAGSLHTVSKEIVPLGLLTAAIISLVTGSLMLTASMLGVPQSFVVIKLASIFAISGLKDGHSSMFAHPIIKKSIATWIVTPCMALLISYGLTGIYYGLLA